MSSLLNQDGPLNDGWIELWRKAVDGEEVATARLQTAEAAMQTPCVWTQEFDGEVWDTQCGGANVFEDGGPNENKYRFCPYCGHPIEVVQP